MKTLKNKILEGLKITSKTKVSKSGEDIETFDDFTNYYKSQLKYHNSVRIIPKKDSDLYNKLNDILNININDEKNYNKFIKDTKDYKTNKYHLDLKSSIQKKTICCFDTKGTVAGTIEILLGSNDDIIINNLSGIVNYREQEELLIKGLNYMISEFV